ncbi:MAG TPA: hypothetical protein VMW10_12130 [Alphaproteobacteria bacterium]|nr:hypothetical protein [Alphaproteobacteria bacterium]
MDPLDKIQRVIDEGGPDSLSKIAEIIGYGDGYQKRVSNLISASRAILDNRPCYCSGWPCTRCKLAIREVKSAIRRMEGK